MRLAWLGAPLLIAIAAFAANCGAVTLEPLPPEEPLPEAAPPPRLMRRDAGAPRASEEEEETPR
jgi:hypothetical protein